MAGGSVARFAPAKDFPVLFEDEHFLAIDKPAGVAVHGGSGRELWRDRAAAHGAAAGDISGAGAPAGPRNLAACLLVAKKRSALEEPARPVPASAKPAKPTWRWSLGMWPANKKVLDKPLHKYLLPKRRRWRAPRARWWPKTTRMAMPSLTLVKVQHPSRRRSRNVYSCWRSPSRPGAPTRSGCTWPSEGMPIAGDDKYGDFRAEQGACTCRRRPGARSACFCMPGVSSAITLRPASALHCGRIAA